MERTTKKLRGYRHLPLIAAALIMLLAGTGWTAPEAPEKLPDGELLISKVLLRAALTNQQPRLEFTRRKTTVMLDRHQREEEREEIVHRIGWSNGIPTSRLLKKNGREATPEEILRDAEGPPKSSRKPGRGARKSQDRFQVESNIIHQFSFKTTGREEVNGRATYVVTFNPKPGLPQNSVQAKVMARLAGRIWIDCEEPEVARFEMKLTEPLKIAAGLLGSLSQLQFELGRLRVSEGAWADVRSRMQLQFRQLLDTKRILAEEECTEIQLIPRQ